MSVVGIAPQKKCSTPGCKSRAALGYKKCGYHVRRDREYHTWRRAAWRRKGFCQRCGKHEAPRCG